jgi:hypothetical protein
MKLKLNKINGTNSFLNYDLLKESFISELQNECDEAELLILNNFPVPVLSQATLDFIIFLKIPFHSNKRPIINNADGFVYITNLIIAVSVINEYNNSKINIEKNELFVDESLIDLNDSARKLKWGLTNYLHDACGLVEREKITVHPIFWVGSNYHTNIGENIIISKNLTFDLIKKCISLNDYLRYPGYTNWNHDNYYEDSIKNIFQQASKDSDLGYITKQKILRYQNKFDEASNNAYKNIGKKLVEVRGKAGSGKSSDILKWMLQKSLTGNKGTFLTYNHLLVYEISKQISGFNYNINAEILSQKATTTTYTIHSFMYNICKKLGVILLMSNSRIEELKNTMNNRLKLIEDYISNLLLIKESYSNNQLITEFQNSNKFDNGTKIEAVDFIKSNILNRVVDTKTNLNALIDRYKKNKIKKLEEQINSDFFLTDYTNVLKKTLEALDNLDVFFNEFDIENKFDLLENTLKLDDTILVNTNGDKKINLDLLKNRYKKSINAFSSKRTLYIDEAQDCHPYERDIFFSLFGTDNIVIASGGKEQLIRYDSVCSWDISKGRKVDNYIYQKRRKSYRMKPAIAALANHIAFTFNIDLNIEPLDSDDHGTILIDRSNKSNFEKKIKIINELLNAGSRQGCSSYESLLLLKNAKEQNFQNNNIGTNNNILINEYDVIRLNQANVRSEWNLIESANNNVNDARFWNATGNVDKRKQSVPGSLSIRAIYYESSRGLESWSTMCFDICGFFESKRNENEADNFLLNEIMEPEHRKNKYAATWVLMALTRSIDTCYLELSDKKNALTDSIESFINRNPKYIKNL